jgi:hypothetical protein
VGKPFQTGRQVPAWGSLTNPQARVEAWPTSRHGACEACGAPKFLFAFAAGFGCLWRMKSSRTIALALLLFSALSAMVSSARAQAPGAAIAEAANNFIATLTPEQRTKAVFELKSDERVNWHFIPKARNGLPCADMSPAQRHLAHALLATTLSHRGYFKAATIMSLEQVLFDLENKAPHRNAELYYFSFFGKPGQDVWGWRAEGHHLSLNFTVRGDTVLATPSFMGSNPAEVLAGPRQGLRILAKEDDLGRQLVKSFDDAQRKLAVITNTAPSDIITSNARKAKRLEPAGLPVARMNKSQREILHALIDEYIARNRAEVARADWAKIEKAGWDQTSFAWAGGLDRGQGHYYRVQGPTFLLEYDNTQNNANHIHAVWRDFENDFGDDLLLKHYEQTPHAK